MWPATIAMSSANSTFAWTRRTTTPRTIAAFDAQSAVRSDILGGDGKPYPEQFHIRQPQHVPLAATLGLGVFDKADPRFEHRLVRLA